MLQGAAAVAAATVFSGCGSNTTSSSSSGGSTTTTSSTNPQPTPTGSLTSATMTVSATSVGAIGSAFAGLSYEKSALTYPLFQASNTDLIGMFERLGPSLLRVGGNSVDETVWTPNGVGRTAGQIAPSDVVALAAFVKAAGWQCLYGVNLGGSATGVQTTALAAAEVAYAAQQFGSSLLGIEIGNECDLYGDTGSYYAGAWSLTQFETLWAQYRTAILATTPGVTITGPASASNESTWTVPFGQSVTKSEIALLTQHYYRGNGQSASSTAANLVTPDTTVVNDLSILKAGAANIGIPFRMSECNSYYNGGASGVSNAYCSSLWIIDYLFAVAQGGAVGANFHGGGDGTGYTPIANDSTTGAVVEARPEFYGILLFTLAGQGTVCQTTVSASSLNVTGYTVKTAAGGLNLIIVNKDSSANLNLAITLPQTVTKATLLEMTQLTAGATGPSLSATEGVTIQGASVNIDGTFSPAAAYTLSPSGTQVSCYVPALSAVLIELS
jgi:hypothetical protein